MPLWPLFRQFTSAASVAASRELHVPTASYSYFFDISLPIGHPRRGLLRTAPPTAPTSIVDATEFELAVGQPRAGVALNELVESVPGDPDLQTVDVITPRAGVVGLKTWPEDVLTALDGWAPGDHTGADGAWVDVQIDEPAQAVALAVNTTLARPFRLLFFGQNAWDQSFGPRPAEVAHAARLLHYPIDLADPADTRHASTLADRNSAPAGWTRTVAVNAGTEPSLPIRGICAGGWYQSGERYILADGEILIPALGAATVEITYHDRARGEQARVLCRIVSSTALAAGYALEVHPQDRADLPSFGNWGDGEPVTISPAVRFTARPDRDVLLTVLHSNGGAQATDATWDREAFGGGLLTADVDQASFSATPAPPGLGQWSPFVERGKRLRDIIEPILKCTSTALVMRRDAQGRCRLTRISVGIESAAEASETITAGEWIAAPAPKTEPDRKIINRFELTTNHADNGAGDGQITLEFEDRASHAANGDGDTLKVELRGLYLDGTDPAEASATFRDLVARWAELSGYARKGWVGECSIGKAWRIGVGSTILVSSPLLRGAKSAFGVTGAAARVVEFQTPLWPTDGAAARLRMMNHGANATAWAPALLAVSTSNATTVTVAANEYSADEHPVTGAALVDLDFFSEGDAVIVRQRYDQDTYVLTAIGSINRSTRKLVFDDAHALTVLAGMGTIEPATYDSQSAAISLSGFAHNALATIADSSGELGAAGDAGYTLL